LHQPVSFGSYYPPYSHFGIVKFVLDRTFKRLSI
jgi:hypothetical protein